MQNILRKSDFFFIKNLIFQNWTFSKSYTANTVTNRYMQNLFHIFYRLLSLYTLTSTVNTVRYQRQPSVVIVCIFCVYLRCAMRHHTLFIAPFTLLRKDMTFTTLHSDTIHNINIHIWRGQFCHRYSSRVNHYNHHHPSSFNTYNY